MRPVVLVRVRRLGGVRALPQAVQVVSRLLGNGTTNWDPSRFLRPPLAATGVMPESETQLRPSVSGVENATPLCRAGDMANGINVRGVTAPR